MQAICSEDTFKNALPHGSGIDAEWRIETLRNGNLVAYCSYHGMDEWGGYDGWQDFSVKLFRHTADKLNPLSCPCAGKVQVLHRKGDVDFTVQFNGGQSRRSWAWGLKDYLYETIDYALGECGLLTRRSCEIIDK